ncbi:MAG: hypothetical protein HY286_15200 [Planctomycetes bacterium]|nr:hypothetical protein [Planctomycetota bacterium]
MNAPIETDRLRDGLARGRRRYARHIFTKSLAIALPTALAGSLGAVFALARLGESTDLGVRIEAIVAGAHAAVAWALISSIRRARQPFAARADRVFNSGLLISTAAETQPRGAVPNLCIRRAEGIVRNADWKRHFPIATPRAGGALLLILLILAAGLFDGPGWFGGGSHGLRAGRDVSAAPPNTTNHIGETVRKPPVPPSASRPNITNPATPPRKLQIPPQSRPESQPLPNPPRQKPDDGGGSRPKPKPDDSPIDPFEATPKVVPIDPLQFVDDAARANREALVLQQKEGVASRSAPENAAPRRIALDPVSVGEMERAAENALGRRSLTSGEAAFIKKYYECLKKPAAAGAK